MTTPAYAPAQQPAPSVQQPQQIPPGASGDTALAVAIAGLLVTAISAAAVLQMLQMQFKLSSIERQALLGSLETPMSFPPPQTGASGSATLATARQNHLRRAQFVVASFRRLLADVKTAVAHNQPVVRALRDGVTRERRFYSQHLGAMWNRATAAARVDSAALTYGDELGWDATLDKRTSPECRAADGRNFRASVMPRIGWPGGVHDHCRCRPCEAYPGAKLLP